MVGVTAAIIGSAVIGAGASAMAGAKNSKAINKATAAQTQSNADATALQRETRQQNLALQQPIYDAGMPAIHSRNALLGLGGSPQASQEAFDAFRNSTGYQFRVNEGMDALNSGYAGAGVLQSGAALKGLDDYRQGMASAEFGSYMNHLGGQQMLGAGAANAMSGVNTNYANNAGNLAIAQGQNLAGGAVAKANNTNAMIGGIGGAMSGALGGFAYSGGGMGGMGGGATGVGMNLRGVGL